MESTINQRIKEIVEKHHNGSVNALAKASGISQSTLKDIVGEKANKPGYDTIIKILKAECDDLFGEINPEWLLFGKGNMYSKSGDPGLGELPEPAAELASTPAARINNDRNDIPYYADLPVSAGELDTFIQDAEPTGWVNLPGVRSKALFPVVGCSMKPEINPGDVVGIVQMDSWEMVDPDKTYLIITHDERMIKHLAVDEVDNTILWCMSPNYPKFKINKSDIKYLYRISFCGKLM